MICKELLLRASALKATGIKCVPFQLEASWRGRLYRGIALKLELVGPQVFLLDGQHCEKQLHTAPAELGEHTRLEPLFNSLFHTWHCFSAVIIASMHSFHLCFLPVGLSGKYELIKFHKQRKYFPAHFQNQPHRMCSSRKRRLLQSVLPPSVSTFLVREL